MEDWLNFKKSPLVKYRQNQNQNLFSCSNVILSYLNTINVSLFSKWQLSVNFTFRTSNIRCLTNFRVQRWLALKITLSNYSYTITGLLYLWENNIYNHQSTPVNNRSEDTLYYLFGCEIRDDCSKTGLSMHLWIDKWYPNLPYLAPNIVHI